MSPKVSNQYKRNKELEILQSAKNVFIKIVMLNVLLILEIRSHGVRDMEQKL